LAFLRKQNKIQDTNSEIIAGGQNVDAVRKSALSTDVFLEGRSGSPSAVDLTIEHGGDD
jgi:hypothetical protein